MSNNKRTLLMLLPFWSPLIPPMGLASLKSFLEPRGFDVKTVDANVESNLRATYDLYFDQLKKVVERPQQGNFYSTGMEVLRNHMMAHFRGEPDRLPKIVAELVYKNFYSEVRVEDAAALDQVLTDFFKTLETYVNDVLARENPDVLGISCFSGTLAASMFTFQLAKEHNPDVMTVMGGGVFADDLSFGTENLKSFLEEAHYIDYLVVGEGEQIFLKLLQGELDMTQRVHTLASAKVGLVNLGELGSPDFSDLDLRYYPYMASYTSRGCPFSCSFCSESDTYRKRDPQTIVEELRRLYESHGARVVLMGDSLLNPVINKLSAAMAESDLPVYWDGYLRADKTAIKAENADLWRRAGFYRARLGVESGSDKVLKMMNKKTTTQEIRKAITLLGERGIKTTTYWVIGYPGETEEDFQETLNLVAELSDNIYEAEASTFTYYEYGQVGSAKWERESNRGTLYSKETSDTLLVKTWRMDCPPSREEVLDRVWRFVEHCKRLGVPNPYSLHEIYAADTRWKDLHTQAVPGLVELMESDQEFAGINASNAALRGDVTYAVEDEWQF